MRLLNFILIIFLILTNGIKADTEFQILKNLKNGGNLIFIRHAYAPGGGDPDNFDINDCSTQRNLNDKGIKQSKLIGKFFDENNIQIDQILSSEWCRCKDTAKYAFQNFRTFDALNSFFSRKFEKNKDKQLKDLRYYIKNWKGKKNLILVTHYVVILEILNHSVGSGEIVVTDKNFKYYGSVPTM